MTWNEEMIRKELERLDRKTGLNGAKLPIKFTHAKHTLGCFYADKDNMRFDFSLYYLADDSFPQEEAMEQSEQLPLGSTAVNLMIISIKGRRRENKLRLPAMSIK